MIKKFKKAYLFEMNEAYIKTCYWFFSYPLLEISLTDLATQLKISKTTANLVVRRLIDEKFLKLQILGKIWRISCEQSHLYNYSKKISYNLTMIYESQIISQIRASIQNPKAIILFGSYRKGDDTEKSDIDIAVEVFGNEDVKIINMAIFQEFGFRKNVKVNLYVFSRTKVDINLFSNIVNGIVLDGFLEARP